MRIYREYSKLTASAEKDKSSIDSVNPGEVNVGDILDDGIKRSRNNVDYIKLNAQLFGDASASAETAFLDA